MIQYVTIGKVKYPFKFGMREIYTISQRANIEDTASEFDEVAKKVSMDFDVFLELFALASKKGARLHKRDTGEFSQALSQEQIEDAIDDDPELFGKLNAMFEKASTVESLEKSEKKPEAKD